MMDATQFALNDERTHAWIAVPDSDLDADWDAARFRALTKLCDTCGHLLRLGDGTVIDTEGRRWNRGRSVARYEPFTCPDCIDGRHTFDIEVVCNNCDGDGFDIPEEGSSCWNCNTTGTVTYRVPVVPGMVLPIYNIFGVGPVVDRTVPHVMMDATGAWFLDGNQGIKAITLPDAARPGMWAVLVKVAT